MIAGQCFKDYPTTPPAMTGPTPDPVPTLDDDDEIAFMASDAGGQAPFTAETFTPPPGTSNGQAVTITDPLDPGTVRAVYLFLKDGGSSYNASNGYVSYVRDPNADQWIDRASFLATDPDGHVLRFGADLLPGEPMGDWLDGDGRRWVPEPGGGWRAAD